MTVRNVADLKGNAISAGGVQAPFRVADNLRWNIVGDPTTAFADWGPFPLEGNFVVPVGETGLDLYSNGRTQWNNYDESLLVHEQITGDFDKKLRVEYQDNASQWACAGLVLRERSNFGENVNVQIGSAEWGNAGPVAPDGLASRYQKVHVNPVGPLLAGSATSATHRGKATSIRDYGHVVPRRFVESLCVARKRALNRTLRRKPTHRTSSAVSVQDEVCD